MTARSVPVDERNAMEPARAALEADVLDGVDPERFPVVAERLAIDVTDALRATDAGVRAFRGRPLGRRLWDGVTGAGQRRVAGTAADLLAAQRGALEIVRELMRAEARTAHCLHHVLVNLHAVNRDLDEVCERVDDGLDEAFAEIDEARLTLLATVRAESARLDARLEAVRSALAREGQVRRLGELYRAGELHRGAGAILDASMWIASVAHHFWDAGERRREAELAAALALVKQKLPARPVPIEDALQAAVVEATDDACASIAYASEGRGSCLGIVGALAERRLAGLSVTEVNVADAIAIARATRRADGVLAGALVRPSELARAIGAELATQDAPTFHPTDDEAHAWPARRERSR